MEESRNGSKDRSKGGSDDDDLGQGELYSPAYSINVRNNKANLDANVGQGELYSPSHAIIVSNNKANQEPSLLLPSSMGLAVAADHISARHFLESVVKDVTGAAHGITKDALHRVRTHLVDILPSLSPETANKMVDEAEREANNIGGGPGREDERKNEEGRQRSGHADEEAQLRGDGADEGVVVEVDDVEGGDGAAEGEVGEGDGEKALKSRQSGLKFGFQHI
ncbi:hypothetical protein C1H46_038281 [Malus baccata]|uniref:Uncharacterized protein n=1 Tax=Malus baccata TaxID=106549 RepID=A0A540KPQ5_MALBA|nr:hypothetical protein C1H46_038281 [Malus baccata]